MRRLAAAVVAAVALGTVAAAPAGATECTPRGCTTSCRLVARPPFIECNS